MTVLLVEQELIVLPEYLSSSLFVSGVHVAQFFIFFYSFLSTIVFLFVFFLLTIALIALLRLTASDLPFGIVRLFFCVNKNCNFNEIPLYVNIQKLEHVNEE
jgi:hypothetical protein